MNIMSIEDYFGKWKTVVPLDEVSDIMSVLRQSKNIICPLLKDTFKAFEICPYDNLKVVILGQDCYPDIRDGKPVATGIAFGNSRSTPVEKYSASLKILMDSFIDFSVPHNCINFDPSLEQISSQGVLFMNTALTCVAGRPGSHMLLWRSFIQSFLRNLSKHKTSIVYVLLGSEAQALKDCIDNRYNYILTDKHPAFYARMKTPMPCGIWKSVNDIIKSINGKEEEIKWFQEEGPLSEGQCEKCKEQESEECNYPSV